MDVVRQLGFAVLLGALPLVHAQAGPEPQGTAQSNAPPATLYTLIDRLRQSPSSALLLSHIPRVARTVTNETEAAYSLALYSLGFYLLRDDRASSFAAQNLTIKYPASPYVPVVRMVGPHVPCPRCRGNPRMWREVHHFLYATSCYEDGCSPGCVKGLIEDVDAVRQAYQLLLDLGPSKTPTVRPP